MARGRRRQGNIGTGLSITKGDRERRRNEHRDRKEHDHRTWEQKVADREAREQRQPW
jgi:hypothetical protein